MFYKSLEQIVNVEKRVNRGDNYKCGTNSKTEEQLVKVMITCKSVEHMIKSWRKLMKVWSIL